MGHLLFKTGNVDRKRMHKFEKESRESGKASFKYAWVLDEHDEERERGVTMDVAVNRFETDDRLVTLLDAPGHRDFIPNMISGAAQADVAVLVVPARIDEFQTAFDGGGQTKEHAVLAHSLGISQVLVAVNKMDAVDWDRARFEDIVATMSTFLIKTGFKEGSVRFIPVSGLTGMNLTAPPSSAEASWVANEFPTLASSINTFDASGRKKALTKPARLCIADVYKNPFMGSSSIVVAGRLQTGTIVVGDKIIIIPQKEYCTVKSIMRGGVTIQAAKAGENIEVCLDNALVNLAGLSSGSVLCDAFHPIPVVTQFTAKIQTLDDLRIPLVRGSQLELHAHSLNVPVVVTKLIGLLDRQSGKKTNKKRPRRVGRNELASIRIEVVTGNRICLEQFSDYRQLGRFLLRERGKTVAAGIVLKIKKVNKI